VKRVAQYNAIIELENKMNKGSFCIVAFLLAKYTLEFVLQLII
jgi:hypothetical protein